MKQLQTGPLAAAILLVAISCFSCTGRGTAPSTVPVPPPEAVVDDIPPEPAEPPPDPTPLYLELDAARGEYLDGAETIAAGDEVAGEARIQTARLRMDEAVEACAEMDTCNLGVFLDALQELLSRQNILLKREAARTVELEQSLAEEPPREPGTSPFVAAMPELGDTVSLLRGNELREIITLNGPVNAAMDDWLTWMRPLFLEAYENYQYLRSKMAPIYEEAGLPEALLFAMLATETGGKVHSYSRAGAAGPLQFMPSTGRKYGLRTVDGFDMRLDPEAATRANVAYLNDQFEALNDDLEKALAAYNGGETRMARLHNRLGGASFWDSRVYWSLPRETRQYVPRILAAAWLFLHAEDYSLELPAYETQTTLLALQNDISLGELSVCLGQTGNPRGWFRTLRNLNPRLDPGDRVDAGDALEVPTDLVEIYQERCLDGEVVERARLLHDANYPEGPVIVPYVVKRGDTLGKIASRHRCVSLRELAELNRIRAPKYVIRLGQRIKIPQCS